MDFNLLKHFHVRLPPVGAHPSFPMYQRQQGTSPHVLVVTLRDSNILRPPQQHDDADDAPPHTRNIIDVPKQVHLSTSPIIEVVVAAPAFKGTEQQTTPTPTKLSTPHMVAGTTGVSKSKKTLDAPYPCNRVVNQLMAAKNLLRNNDTRHVGNSTGGGVFGGIEVEEERANMKSKHELIRATMEHDYVTWKAQKVSQVEERKRDGKKQLELFQLEQQMEQDEVKAAKLRQRATQLELQHDATMVAARRRQEKLEVRSAGQFGVSLPSLQLVDDVSYRAVTRLEMDQHNSNAHQHRLATARRSREEEIKANALQEALLIAADAEENTKRANRDGFRKGLEVQMEEQRRRKVEESAEDKKAYWDCSLLGGAKEEESVLLRCPISKAVLPAREFNIPFKTRERH